MRIGSDLIHEMDAGVPVDKGTGPHQVLAAALTLLEPEGADYAH